ncbi:MULTISPECIES: hypothetical protein [unclassified Endozoicomonas]|uniref:hypothetical protein n=1 Tax=unclassified Endozoicomonas TaxID=2644528 RepID=UPI003BB7CBAF
MNITSSKPLCVQDLQEAIADVANKPLVTSHFERKNTVSLFRSIQDRTITGIRISGSVSDNLQFLSTLENRQLLTTAEVMALSRAVVNGECIISPEQCKFPLSINLLRWLSGFLRIMERSPLVKMAVEKIIIDAPVHSAVDFLMSEMPNENKDNVEDFLKINVMTSMLKSHSQMKSVKDQCDKYISENQSSMTDEEKKLYLYGLLLPFWDDWEEDNQSSLLARNQFFKLNFSFHYEHMINVINQLDENIQYSSCMHERIDRLGINKVLILKKEFCELVRSVAFQRLPDENIPCLDDMELNKLFDTRALLDRSYAEFTKYQTVGRVRMEKSPIVPMALAEKDLEHLYVNYMGIHLELDLGDKRRANLVNFIGLNSRCYSALGSRFNSINKYIGDVYHNKYVELCYTAFQDWFRDHKTTKLETMSCFHQLWCDDYSKMNDIKWFVSIIARAGLMPGNCIWFSDNPSLICPECHFKENLKKVEKSGLSNIPETIRQFASELIRLLQHHSERDCHLAQSIDPQRLWNEKYEGKLPSGYF